MYLANSAMSGAASVGQRVLCLAAASPSCQANCSGRIADGEPIWTHPSRVHARLGTFPLGSEVVKFAAQNAY
jgi:hypothetical protein